MTDFRQKTASFGTFLIFLASLLLGGVTWCLMGNPACAGETLWSGCATAHCAGESAGFLQNPPCCPACEDREVGDPVASAPVRLTPVTAASPAVPVTVGCCFHEEDGRRPLHPYRGEPGLNINLRCLKTVVLLT